MKKQVEDAQIGMYSGTGLVLGAAVGLVFGAAFGQPGIGLVFGAGLGLVFGAAVPFYR